MPINICYGSIFTSNCDFLVNPTNSIGVMGAGLAKKFAGHYPLSCGDYNVWSKNQNRVKPYKLLPVRFYNGIIMFPTKIDWRNSSDVSYIETGLQYIKENLSKENSIAFPLLGAGLGGLDPEVVINLIKEYMQDHPKDVEIWRDKK